jgi:O-acetylhomoserine (thiol)-lyase
VRVSIGIEDVEDIMWDLEQALVASQADTPRQTYDGQGHSVLAKAFGAPYQS